MEQITSPIPSNNSKAGTLSRLPTSLRALTLSDIKSTALTITIHLSVYIPIAIFFVFMFQGKLSGRPDWEILILPSSSSESCSFFSGQEFEDVSASGGCHVFGNGEEVHAMLWTSKNYGVPTIMAEEFGNCSITLYSDDECSGIEVRKIPQANIQAQNPKTVFCESDFTDDNGEAIGARSMRTECN